MLYLLIVRVFGKSAEKWYLLLPICWGEFSENVILKGLQSSLTPPKLKYNHGIFQTGST